MSDQARYGYDESQIIARADTAKFGRVDLVDADGGGVEVHTERGGYKHLTLQELGGIAHDEDLAECVLLGRTEDES